MKTYNLINKQTGIIEFIGNYDECLVSRKKLIEIDGGLQSNPNDYYLIVIIGLINKKQCNELTQ